MSDLLCRRSAGGILLSFCIGLSAANGQAPDSRASLTVEEAVDEAIRNNLGLFAQQANLPIADAARITAGLRPNPVISTAADHLDWLGTRFNEVNAAGPPEISFRLDVPLERRGKRQLRLETAGYGRSIAEAQITDSVRRLRLQIVLACLDVLEAKSKLALARDGLANLVQLVELNEKRLASGAISPLEVTRSRVAMLQYRAGVRTAELDWDTARARLLPLLGRRSSQQVADIQGEIKIPLAGEAPALPAIEEAALRVRPDLDALKREQARTQADLRLQIAQGKIDYSIGMEYRRQQGVNGRGNMVGFFFSAPLPVFNRNQGEIARAEAEQERARRAIRTLETEVAGEVLESFRQFESSRRLVGEIESTLLEQARQARDTTTFVYQRGATTLLDVLDAQRTFNETMQIYYTAQANYRRALVRLNLTVGEEIVK